MSLPSAVLLDTSVLAGQQYNFGSVAMSSFVPAAAAKKIVLLLPAPTEQEILNQIDERSKEALQALETAKRKAPFLEKWEHFPKVRPDAASLDLPPNGVHFFGLKKGYVQIITSGLSSVLACGQRGAP
jgi:hypothetical protein